jgi:hypothetical protein
MAAHDIFLLAFLVVMIGLLVRFRKELRDLADAITDEINRRGGPPTAMPPLPSTDAHLLFKRIRKEKRFHKESL